MIREGYPFEQNTWSCGVKAVDVARKKQRQAAICEEDGIDPKDVDDVHKPEGQFTEGPDADGNESRHEQIPKSCCTKDIHHLIHITTYAFEERALGMYEGYNVSVKDHTDFAVGKLKAELVDMILSPESKCAQVGCRTKSTEINMRDEVMSHGVQSVCAASTCVKKFVGLNRPSKHELRYEGQISIY